MVLYRGEGLRKENTRDNENNKDRISENIDALDCLAQLESSSELRVKTYQLLPLRGVAFSVPRLPQGYPGWEEGQLSKAVLQKG